MKGPKGEVHDRSTLDARSEKVSRTDAVLVAAFLTPPAAWALNLSLAYALVFPAAQAESKAALWVSALVCGALTILAALVATAAYLGTLGTSLPEGARSHTRALAAAACVASVFFLLAIVAQTIPLGTLGLHDR
jgi:hypothetical protein